MDIELQPPRQLTPWLPVVSVCIGTFALCFQIFVLYPWHTHLSAQFANLQRYCMTDESRGGM
jgi:hypothetical protein